MKQHIFSSWKIAHFNFIDKLLGSLLHSFRLLDLGVLLVASPVVSTLTPHINMLAPIAGTPLDLLHFIVGACLGLLALGAPPHQSRSRHWPFPKVGRPLRYPGFNGRLRHPSR